MTVLSYQAIKAELVRGRLISPWVERTVFSKTGTSYGLGPASYDVRTRDLIKLWPKGFVLASTLERFKMPSSIGASVRDKSSLAREGIQAMNTWIDPGWEGYLTLELVNHSDMIRIIPAGAPIVQIVFEYLNQATVRPYSGKYQNQADEPVPALREDTGTD